MLEVTGISSQEVSTLTNASLAAVVVEIMQGSKDING